MSTPSFRCRHCGLCCTEVPGAFENSADLADIQRWEDEGRDDILAWVLAWYAGWGAVLYELWVNPKTGNIADGCPWLEWQDDGTCTCRIHDTKPKHCRDWPLCESDARSAGCTAYD